MKPIDKIKDLYIRFPEAKREFQNNALAGFCTYSFENLLKKLEELENFELPSLERFDGYVLFKLISPLPVKVLAEELSEELILFTFLRNSNDHDFSEKVKKITNKDLDLLSKSKSVAEKSSKEKNFSLITRNYQLYEQIMKEISSLPLERLLKNNSLPQFNWNENKLNKYSLCALTVEGISDSGFAKTWGCWYKNEGHIDLYLDAPVGICVLYKKIPNAFITFYSKNQETIFVPQIQGVRPHKISGEGLRNGRKSSRGLAVLDWRKLLIESIEEIGKKMNFQTIEIQSAHNNGWTKIDYRGDVKLPLERGIQIYDKEAERMGFTQREDKNWVRSL
ncbi:hypothetical protein HZA97_09210 [Candidatus Woesearchaeota archaeon]|nr:hypothetical protein [Candidatus Woesearchaeota archaeon]